MNKKILPIIIISSAVVACNNTNGGQKELNYKSAYKEVETFFNSPNNDFTMRIVSGTTTTSLMSFYSDSEMVMSYPYNRPSLKEISTKDKSILDGDGYKVYIDKDNSTLFNNESIDIAKYFKSSSYSKEDQTFSFTLNLKEASSKTDLFDSETLDELVKEMSFDLENVDFLVNFYEKRITTLSMVFDSYIQKLLGVFMPLRIVYAVNGYGDVFTKRTIDVNSYLRVDQKTYDFVEKDFAYVLEYGKGYEARSNVYSNDYFVNSIPDNRVMAYLEGPNSSFDIEILGKDGTYDKETGKFNYSYAGKSYSIKINMIETKTATKQGTVAYDKIETKSKLPHAYDLDNDRYIFSADNKVTILEISTLNVLKQFDVEGDVNKILVHDGVYHITTTTLAPSTGYHTESDNRGIIYVIDKTSLEVIDKINMNTAPDYTAIDKRGDIIVCPGRGQWVPLYIYHPTTKTAEIFAGLEHFFYHGSYLVYDKEQDMLITNNTQITSGINPNFFIYKDGQYVPDTSRNGKVDKGPSFATVYLDYNGYIVSNSHYLVNVKNWEKPSCEEYINIQSSSYDSRMISFPGEDNIYIVASDGQCYSFIIKVDTNTGERTTYCATESLYDSEFGLFKDDKIYLYSNTNKSFTIVELE
ncbi:MAG: hypothetical protein J6N95_05820 [Bacilli bacterium]|nr:hypothetical protein [Bacilli bacterium]